MDATTTVDLAIHDFAIPGLAGANAAVAIVRVGPADLQAGPLAGWLAREEIDRFHRFKVEHARVDFLAGRIAAKSALIRLVPQSRPADWELVLGVWRQPCVRGPFGGLKVTLAHSAGVAVAVAFDDRWTCGIDLEESTRDAAEVVESQVTGAEADWARAAGADMTTRWMLLWTAREAIGKSFGTGLLFPSFLPASRDWHEIDGFWHARVGNGDLLAIRSIMSGRFALSWLAPAAAAQAPVGGEMLQWLRATLAAWTNHALPLRPDQL